MKKFLTSIDDFLGNVFKRIENNSWVDTQSLAYFRIFFGVFMLSHYLPEWQWFGGAPQAFFSPHLFTMASLVDGFLPEGFYLLLDILNIALFCLVTLGIRTRLAFGLLFLINYTGYSFEFSFGKIDHEVHLYLITLLTLAFTNIGTKSAFIKDKVLKPGFQKWALSLLSIYIAFGFLTAGLPKFIKWVDFDINQIGFLEWFFKGYYTYDRHLLLADSVFRTPYMVFEIADYLAPTIELLGFVFLLWGRRAWRIYLAILCTFHMGNMLFLNIEFALNIACYGIFLIAPFLTYLSKYMPKGRSAKNLLLTVVGFLALFQIGRKIYYADYVYYPEFYPEKFAMDSYISVFMWIATISIGIFTVKNKLYDLSGE